MYKCAVNKRQQAILAVVGGSLTSADRLEAALAGYMLKYTISTALIREMIVDTVTEH